MSSAPSREGNNEGDRDAALEELLVDHELANGEERERVILAYREKKIAKSVIRYNPEHYTVENAAEWIVIPRFARFLSEYCQEHSPPKTRTRSQGISQSERGSSPSLQVSSSTTQGRIEQTGKPSLSTRVTRSSVTRPVNQSIPKNDEGTREDVEVVEDGDNNDSSSVGYQESRFSSEAIAISSDSDELYTRPKKRPRITDTSNTTVTDNTIAARVKVTRLLSVDILVDLDDIPRTWEVSEDITVKTAYVLDLTGSQYKFLKKDGKPMSILAIIRAQDPDGWRSISSGGTREKDLSVVYPLGSVKCRKATLICQGVYTCQFLDSRFVEHCQRYGADEASRQELLEAAREQNRLQYASSQHSAAAFYGIAITTPCGADGGRCAGVAVCRPLTTMNFDSKMCFIGCSGWVRNEQSREHRFLSIPRNVDEHAVERLFRANGSLEGALPPEGSETCATILSRRSGGKINTAVENVHCNDGKIGLGELRLHPCNTRLEIWYPVEETDRRAIVMVTSAHTHPFPPEDKLTPKAEEDYAADVKESAHIHPTVRKVDQFRRQQGHSSLHAGLNRTRNKEEIIRRINLKECPEGQNLDGVKARRRDELKWEPAFRYVHHIFHEDGIDIIVTMLPGLAQRLHLVRATLHDNTYKRVKDSNFKEWETVIWDPLLNTRLTVARIYCTHENQRAFELMFKAFFDTVEEVTGKKLPISFLDGDSTTGLVAIVVDADTAQAGGCGMYLLSRNNPVVSGIHTNNPYEIITYILMTCLVHYFRNLERLRGELAADEFEHLRLLPDYTEEAQWIRFHDICRNRTKKVRDWYAHKTDNSWVIPSLNQTRSRITPEHWKISPLTTNSNESAHALTNAHTGIGLTLLVAIKSAYEFDCMKLATVEKEMNDGVLARAFNGLQPKMKRNMLRQESKLRKAEEHRANVKNLQILEAEAKSAKAALEAYKAETGLKRSKGSKKGKDVPAMLTPRGETVVSSVYTPVGPTATPIPTPDTPYPFFPAPPYATFPSSSGITALDATVLSQYQAQPTPGLLDGPLPHEHFTYQYQYQYQDHATTSNAANSSYLPSMHYAASNMPINDMRAQWEGEPHDPFLS